MAEFDDVVTDRRLTRRLVEQHLAASAHEPSLLLDEYVCLVVGRQLGPARRLRADAGRVHRLRGLARPAGVRPGTGRGRAAARRPGARHRRRRFAGALQRLRRGRRHRAAGPAHPRAGDTAGARDRRPAQCRRPARPARLPVQAGRAGPRAAGRAADHRPAVGDLGLRTAHPSRPRRHRTGIRGAGDRRVRVHRGTGRPQRARRARC